MKKVNWFTISSLFSLLLLVAVTVIAFIALGLGGGLTALAFSASANAIVTAVLSLHFTTPPWQREDKDGKRRR